RPPTRLRQVPGRGLSSVRDSTPMMSGSAYQRAAFTATSGALLAYLHLVGTVLTADRGVQLGVSLRRDLLQLVEVALRLLLSVRGDQGGADGTEDTHAGYSQLRGDLQAEKGSHGDNPGRRSNTEERAESLRILLHVPHFRGAMVTDTGVSAA